MKCRRGQASFRNIMTEITNSPSVDVEAPGVFEDQPNLDDFRSQSRRSAIDRRIRLGVVKDDPSLQVRTDTPSAASTSDSNAEMTGIAPVGQCSGWLIAITD